MGETLSRQVSTYLPPPKGSLRWHMQLNGLSIWTHWDQILHTSEIEQSVPDHQFPRIPRSIFVLDPVLAKAALERDCVEKGLPKPMGLTGSNPCRMTHLCGSSWRRHRKVLTGKVIPAALGDGLAIRIAESVATVMKSKIHATKRTEIDLWKIIEPSSMSWIGGLVLGETRPESFDDVFLDCFWKPNAKAKQKVHNLIKKQLAIARKALLEKKSQHGEHQPKSIIDAMVMHTDGVLEDYELIANCDSFLYAGFSAVNTLMMATLLMLGATRHKNIRKAVKRNCEEMCQDNTKLTQAYTCIAAIKKVATSGKTFASLPPELVKRNEMVLVRCLLETLRRFPPVASFTRRVDNSTTECPVIASKCPFSTNGSFILNINVIACNFPKGKRSPLLWNPERKIETEGRLCTFGISDRHCPAGTAALLASFTFLRYIFESYDISSFGDKHVETVYRYKTLTFKGPQKVTFSPWTNRCSSEIIMT